MSFVQKMLTAGLIISLLIVVASSLHLGYSYYIEDRGLVANEATLTILHASMVIAVLCLLFQFGIELKQQPFMEKIWPYGLLLLRAVATLVAACAFILIFFTLVWFASNADVSYFYSALGFVVVCVLWYCFVLDTDNSKTT